MSDQLIALQEKLNYLRARFWTISHLEDDCFTRLNLLFTEKAGVSDMIESLEKSVQQMRASENPKTAYYRIFSR